MDRARQAMRQIGVADISERGQIRHDASLEDNPGGGTRAKVLQQLRHALQRLIDLGLNMFAQAIGAKLRQPARNIFEVKQDKDDVWFELCKGALWIEQLIDVGTITAHLQIEYVV